MFEETTQAIETRDEACPEPDRRAEREEEDIPTLTVLDLPSDEEPEDLTAEETQPLQQSDLDWMLGGRDRVPSSEEDD